MKGYPYATPPHRGWFPPLGWCEMRGYPESAPHQRQPGSATRWTPPFVPDKAREGGEGEAT